MTKVDIRKKAMLDAMTKTLGIVTQSCELAGIVRETHYRWLKDDAKYKTDIDAISEIALDFAESKLHKLIEKGEMVAVLFYLKTKGKNRGYIERQEFTGKDGGEIERKITIEVKNPQQILSVQKLIGNGQE